MAESGGFKPPATTPFARNVVCGKVALITGGGSGIGFEIGRQLGLHGAQLLLMGRRLQVLEEAAETLRKEGIQVEISQGEVRSDADAVKAVSAAVSKFGHLDILVNAAAGNFLVPAENLSTKGFKTVLDIDTVGTFNMCRAAFEPLKETGQGRPRGSLIINISATLHYGATWYQCHASAAKAAIDSLTRSLGLEWGEYGIRVNGIAPGPIANTAGFRKLGPSDKLGVEMRDVSGLIPLGRLGATWDIAMAALFLASSAGSWITGETIVVDGGSWIGNPRHISREGVLAVSRRVEAESKSVGIAGQPMSKL